MTKWGETQSLFQIGLALNVAYFAIREIRTPALARHDLEIAKVEKACDAVLSLVDRYRNVSPIKDRVGFYELTVDTARQNLDGLKSPYSDDMMQKEAIARFGALVAACISFGLLVASTYWYGRDVDGYLLLGAIVVCFAPPALFVAYNLVVLSMMRGTTGDVRRIGRQIAELDHTIKTRDIPAIQR